MGTVEVVSVESATVARRTVRRPALLGLAPPTAALFYPFLLELFHLSISHYGFRWVTVSSLLLLAAIAAPPVTGVYVCWRLGSDGDLSPSAVRARGLALLAVAAAPLYTTLGVLLTIAHNPVPDLTAWVILWVGASALLVWKRPDTSAEVETGLPALHPRLRFAHGVSAALIVCIFLAMHLINHLSALWSLEDQRLLMNVFRHIYRARLVEPLLVTLILFQMATGFVLVRKYIRRAVDLRRTLQIASGAYLLFYLPTSTDQGTGRPLATGCGGS